MFLRRNHVTQIERDCSANPCVGLCFWSELDADCCYIRRLMALRGFRPAVGTRIATSYEIWQHAEDTARSIAFSCRATPSAASISSAVSVGAVGHVEVCRAACLRATDELEIGLYLPKKRKPDFSKNTSVNQVSRAVYLTGCRNNLGSKLRQGVALGHRLRRHAPETQHPGDKSGDSGGQGSARTVGQWERNVFVLVAIPRVRSTRITAVFTTFSGITNGLVTFFFRILWKNKRDIGSSPCFSTRSFS